MQISERIHLVGSEQIAISHPLDCNCYLLNGGSALAIVDSGLGLGVDDILANVEGAAALRERTGAEVWAPADQTHMADPTTEPGVRLNVQYGRYPDGFELRACAPDRVFGDGEQIRVGDLELRTIVVQGHSKDSTCLAFEDGPKRCLFTGDVVFYAGKLGILNLAGFSLDDYRRDIHKLVGLNIDALLPGHGVFVLRRGQKHIERAIRKLSDFVMPETFFEDNEFVWDREYLKDMTE